MIACQRSLFRIPDDVAYFNCAYTAPLLRHASQAGVDAVQMKSTPWQIKPPDFFSTLEENRELFSRLIGCERDHIAIIPAVSYGIALAAKNLPVSRGETILVLEEQFPSNVYVWHRLAQEKGASVKTIPRPVDHNWTRAVLDAIESKTAVAALSNCHWTDGTRLDLVRIGEKCRNVGAALVVDGIQSLGAMPFSVSDSKPDFLVAGAHKWLLGPYSFGFCYVDPKWHHGTPLEENWMNRAGSEDFSGLVDYQDLYQSGARRFDMGEASNFILAPIASAALRQILDWGVEDIGETLGTVTARIADRATDLGLHAAPASARSPHMVGVTAPQGLPDALLNELSDQKIFVSVRGNAIRIAPHLYNTEAEVDRLMNALKDALSR